MNNTSNLKPNSDRTPEERKELATKAGKASGVARAKRAMLRDELLNILDLPAKTNKKISTRRYIANKLIEACEVDVCKAFPIIRDTIGEKVAEKIDATINTENQELLKRYLEEIKHGKSYRQEAED